MKTTHKSEKLPKIPEKYQQIFSWCETNAKNKVSCLYEKELKVKKKAKGFDKPVVKKSRLELIIGVDYLSLESVQEKHESGERERVGFSENMKKINANAYHHVEKDKWYLGAAPVPDSNTVTIFTVDGKTTDLDDVVHECEGKEFTLRDILYASDLKGGQNDWVILPVDNISSLQVIEE